jgi:antitoxin MazE
MMSDDILNLEPVRTILSKWERQDYITHVKSNAAGIPLLEIPASIRREMLIEAGAEVQWTKTEDGTLTLTISPPAKYNLDDLVVGITPENCHEYLDTGNAVGKEVW